MRQTHAGRAPSGFRVKERHGEPIGHDIEHRIRECWRQRPVRPRAINASSIAEYAVAPVAISTIEIPTRAGSFGLPVTEHSPDSA